MEYNKEVSYNKLTMSELSPFAMYCSITQRALCNERGAKMMRKTWLKEAGITDVSAFFSLEDASELRRWSRHFSSVSARSYMRGYRDIYKDVGWFHKLLIHFCDRFVKMKIVKILFGG